MALSVARGSNSNRMWSACGAPAPGVTVCASWRPPPWCRASTEASPRVACRRC